MEEFTNKNAQDATIGNQTQGAVFNRVESMEEVERIIDVKLAQTQRNALEADEMQALLHRKSILESEDTHENKSQLERVNKILSEHMVVVQNLFEYKTLLEKTGIPNEQVIDLLSHENAPRE